MLSMSGDASTLQLLITNGADIAGASTSGVANGNLVAISSIRGAGSAEQAWSALIAGHATLTAGALKEQTSATNRQLLADQAREDVSGVNLDREAAELIRLQQAYQASARIIQVARETTQAIFDIF
jgi:flagellar hook-associated protein 1 FlgK